MKTISSSEVDSWINNLEKNLRPILQTDGDGIDAEAINSEKIGMIGIKTGGVTVASRLHKALGLETPLGELNISFYRDDFSRIGLHPIVEASDMPFSVEGMHVILVDDVLHTGRTIRAALNEIFDYGRPAMVTLVVLVEREGRELPIQADLIGSRVSLETDQQIKLNIATMECQIGRNGEFA